MLNQLKKFLFHAYQPINGADYNKDRLIYAHII